MTRHPAAILFLLLFLAVGVATGTARADVIGHFGDWAAMKETEGKDKVCFAVTLPQKSEGDYQKRGDVFLIVTHRPAEKAAGVVSIQAGYDYQARSDADVRVGAKTFRLFTEGGNAWARDAATDHAVVAAMRAGDRMTVAGTSSRGTRTTDTFSLSGFTAAYQAISKACGVK